MSSILRQCLNCKLKKKNGERPENEYSIGELDYITGSLIKTLIGRLKEVNVNATTSETNNGISYSLFPLDFA